jgi:hypothetical protein
MNATQLPTCYTVSSLTCSRSYCREDRSLGPTCNRCVRRFIFNGYRIIANEEDLPFCLSPRGAQSPSSYTGRHQLVPVHKAMIHLVPSSRKAPICVVSPFVAYISLTLCFERFQMKFFWSKGLAFCDTGRASQQQRQPRTLHRIVKFEM